jgi:hypothetical protein
VEVGSRAMARSTKEVNRFATDDEDELQRTTHFYRLLDRDTMVSGKKGSIERQGDVIH